MNEAIKNIVLDTHKKIEDRRKELDNIAKDIELAKGLLDGRYSYCKDCDDFYMSKSFFEEKETREEEICTYVDPINSSGNLYKDGYVDITYLVCPKGHKHVISRKEREK